MSQILDAHPETAQWVLDDLVGGQVSARHGRGGLSGEQVLRVILVKQLGGFSYDELAFHLADSTSYRAFCRLGITQQIPTAKTLQHNVKLVRPHTLEQINRLLVKHASATGLEDGQKLRVDCTVMETNVHDPSDSSLLKDSVHVLTRLIQRARKYVAVEFTNHRRCAKRRALAILHARTNEERLPLYQQLLKITEQTMTAAQRALAAGPRARPPAPPTRSSSPLPSAPLISRWCAGLAGHRGRARPPAAARGPGQPRRTGRRKARAHRRRGGGAARARATLDDAAAVVRGAAQGEHGAVASVPRTGGARRRPDRARRGSRRPSRGGAALGAVGYGSPAIGAPRPHARRRRSAGARRRSTRSARPCSRSASCSRSAPGSGHGLFFERGTALPSSVRSAAVLSSSRAQVVRLCSCTSAARSHLARSCFVARSPICVSLRMPAGSRGLGARPAPGQRVPRASAGSTSSSWRLPPV